MNPLALSKAREGKSPRRHLWPSSKRAHNHQVQTQTETSCRKSLRAITDPNETAAWLPMLEEFNLELGDKVVMDFSGGDCPPNEHNPDDIEYSETTVLEAPNILEVLGSSGGLRFELRPLGDQCELMLTAINHPDMGIH